MKNFAPFSRLNRIEVDNIPYPIDEDEWGWRLDKKSKKIDKN